MHPGGPMAELIAQLNPDFQRGRRLDRRNIGVLLGDLVEVNDSMRLSIALEDLPLIKSPREFHLRFSMKLLMVDRLF